jgi:arabinogalactan endo-1,4-beta-galactosidase
MLPAYEKAGATYYTHSGQSISDVITYFKEEGMNAMRVRLFVNPTKQTTNESNGTYTWVTDDNVCQDLDWVESLGKRIKDAGLKFMLDIHYSDTWADPGKQWTPAAWDRSATTTSPQRYTTIRKTY